LFESLEKKGKKSARPKATNGRRPVVRRKSKPAAVIDVGTAAAESIFLMYDAREAAHSKSKA
jgi:hypothetical protein